MDVVLAATAVVAGTSWAWTKWRRGDDRAVGAEERSPAKTPPVTPPVEATPNEPVDERVPPRNVQFTKQQELDALRKLNIGPSNTHFFPEYFIRERPQLGEKPAREMDAAAQETHRRMQSLMPQDALTSQRLADATQVEALLPTLDQIPQQRSDPRTRVFAPLAGPTGKEPNKFASQPAPRGLNAAHGPLGIVVGHPQGRDAGVAGIPADTSHPWGHWLVHPSQDMSDQPAPRVPRMPQHSTIVGGAQHFARTKSAPSSAVEHQWQRKPGVNLGSSAVAATMRQRATAGEDATQGRWIQKPGQDKMQRIHQHEQSKHDFRLAKIRQAVDAQDNEMHTMPVAGNPPHNSSAEGVEAHPIIAAAVARGRRQMPNEGGYPMSGTAKVLPADTDGAATWQPEMDRIRNGHWNFDAQWADNGEPAALVTRVGGK